jgi:hypothetical protein
MEDLRALVEGGDPDELLIAVDRLCAAAAWDALTELAARCRAATEYGRQLWGVAMHIDYRLAREGPAEEAARVLRPGAGRFTLGPLTEVAAGGHSWDELAPHLRDPVVAADVAQERALRGEDLRGRAEWAASELPLRILSWEPRYALPAYRERSAAFPQPEVATRHISGLADAVPAERLPDDDGVAALRALVGPWVTQSSGTVRAVTVSGTAGGAVGQLAPRAALAAMAPDEALAVLQWAGASGGAHGRRPGGAAGRFSAWWAAAALTGLGWPVQPDELGAAIAELRWFRWTGEGAEAGWVLRVAVEDPVDGLAWAVEGLDWLDGSPDQ